MMVNCPGCNTSYLVDDRKITSSGVQLNCRECGHKWKVGAARPERITAPLPAAGTPPAPPRRSQTAPIPPPPAGAAASTVECPSCHHRFVPGSGTGPQRAAASGATPSSSQPATRVTGQKRRVLLVEDQNYFAELTREALGERYETVVAANLNAARGLLAKGQYDLVILDLSLEEGQDGTQLLRTTRQRNIPVLIFTARDETDMYGTTWDQLRAAGATDVLIKGMNVGDELRLKVTSLLGDANR